MGQTRTERSRRWIEMVQELGLLKNHVQRVDFFFFGSLANTAFANWEIRSGPDGHQIYRNARYMPTNMFLEATC